MIDDRVKLTNNRQLLKPQIVIICNNSQFRVAMW